MITRYLGFLFIFINNSLFAQDINLDSLQKEVVNYNSIKRENGWNAYVLDYISKDSLRKYTLHYDKNNKLESSPMDIAVYFSQFDSAKREIEFRQYDINGKLAFTDHPPVISFFYDYFGNTIRKDYSDGKGKVTTRFEYEFDSLNREVSFKLYDKKLELSRKDEIEYREDGKVVLERSYDSNNKLIAKNGFTISFSRYETSNRKRLLEQKCLDENESLVLAQNMFGEKYAVIKYIYENPEKTRIEYYDTKGNKLQEKWRIEK